MELIAFFISLTDSLREMLSAGHTTKVVFWGQVIGCLSLPKFPNLDFLFLLTERGKYS